VAGVGEASILTEPAVELERKIRAGEARVGVLGLGYVGLPLCVEFATAGLRVVGYDLARDRVANVNAGRSHIGMCPPSGGGARALGPFVGLLRPRDGRRVRCIDHLRPTPLSKTKDPDCRWS